MRRLNHRLPVASRRRPGFTLVELLIVITIIIALMALTVSAAMRFIGVSEVRTTQTLVHKIHDVFDKHWQAVIAKANQEPLPANIVSLGDPSLNETEKNQRARIIYIKLRLRQEFPMSFAEAHDPAPLPPLPTYDKTLPVSMTGKIDPVAECSACLLLAMQQARSGIKFNPEDLGAGTTTDVDKYYPGVRGIIDTWGQPIVFCRWPTGSAEMASLNPAPTNSPQAKSFRDPQDPNGLLMSPPWNQSTTNGKWFNDKIHAIRDGNGKPFARFTMPVIWSFGPDKQPGVKLDTLAPDGTNKGYDNDNIYSYRLRLGGS